MPQCCRGDAVQALLISTYEMGRQPFGLASPAAWLRAAGWDVVCADLSRDRLDVDAARSAALIAFYLPMHTATRLAAPVISRVRQLNPGARLCAYGIYAPLNENYLRRLGVQDVLGGEFETDLAAVAERLVDPDLAREPSSTRRGRLPRIEFLVPDRSSLPALSRYATLQHPDGHQIVAGYTEASRGCRHLCRHCPIVPVYEGQFRIVQPDVVLADIDAQIAAGARHITFGDPDFFNGPTHAMRVIDALHASHPSVTYDVTIKVEHLLQHRNLLGRLAATGCAFVTSAVESVDDHVLAALEKGHTRADFVEAVQLCRAAGVTLAPTFVAFHPWTTMESYGELLRTIDELGLVDHVAPIQLAIRLLIPERSRLLDLAEIRTAVGDFDEATLTYRWAHPEPAVDALQAEVWDLVAARPGDDRARIFDDIATIAAARVGRSTPETRPRRARATVPYLNEPWYC